MENNLYDLSYEKLNECMKEVTIDTIVDFISKSVKEGDYNEITNFVGTYIFRLNLNIPDIYLEKIKILIDYDKYNFGTIMNGKETMNYFKKLLGDVLDPEFHRIKINTIELKEEDKSLTVHYEICPAINRIAINPDIERYKHAMNPEYEMRTE